MIGHVDAGKSTTTGQLLFQLGGLNERDLEKLRKEAQELGKESFLFAFFMDKSKDERARGVTIACTTREFFTDSYHYTIIDAPGHRFVCQCLCSFLHLCVSPLYWRLERNFFGIFSATSLSMSLSCFFVYFWAACLYARDHLSSRRFRSSVGALVIGR